MRKLYLLWLLLFPSLAYAQGLPAPTACPQFFSATGQPLAGGLLGTFRSGTLIPQATFTDSTLSTANSTPVQLDAGGFATNPSGGCGLWMDPNLTYTFTLRTSQGIQLWSVDGLTVNNSAALLSQANTWTQPQTFNGGFVSAGPNTLNGTTTFNGPFNIPVFEGVRFADQYPSLQAAVNDCSACEIYIPAGQSSPSLQVGINHTVWIHGAGMGQTVIKPTALLSLALFNITAPSESVKFSDLTIDMSNGNAQTQNVFNFNGAVRPVLENVRIIYPFNSGTGTAIQTVATGEMHARNVIIGGAGVCIDVNGDAQASQESFWDDIVCENPGTAGYRLLRTTTTDTGGQYLTHVKVTNPQGRGGAQAFVVSSSATNTGQPFFCVQCVGDGVTGGHTYYFHNVVNIFLDTIWATNSASAGSNFAAVDIDNSTNVFIKGGYEGSASKDLILSGSDTTVVIDKVLFAGSNTNIYATGATLNGITLRDPVFAAATPMSVADRSAITVAASTFMSANAFRVDVSGTGSGTSAFQLHDVDAADATPNTYIRTGPNSGTFQILNNAFSQTFAINQAGTVATLGADRTIFHGFSGTCTMSSGTTCTFSINSAFTSPPNTYVSLAATATPPGTAISAKCAVSGTTVTVTAGTSNSLPWTCLLVGAPD